MGSGEHAKCEAQLGTRPGGIGHCDPMFKCHMLISPTSLDILKQLLPSFKLLPNHVLDFPGGLVVKNLPAHAED